VPSLFLGSDPLAYIFTHAKGEEGKGEREAAQNQEEAGGEEEEVGVRGEASRSSQPAMGDSSGSVSIDVERIYFGGKVRARIPVLG
jgi:hypothetical protein